jgi:hypothetical protein
MTSTARSSVYHDVSGATEHAPPPRRIALDGNSYTEEKFAEWYGKEYRHMWDSASPSGQEPQRGAETADAVAADKQTAGAAEHNVPAVQFVDKVQDVQKPYHRRARLVNKRLSVADAVLSQQADREAKFKRLISDVSTSLIDEFIDEELRKIARGIRTTRDRERLSFLRCTLCNALSCVEHVVEFDQMITGRNLYQLARRALGLKPNADSTSIRLTLEGVEVLPNDWGCWKRFKDARIEYVLHK